MDNYFFQHIRDLSEKAYKSGISTFSSFLGIDEQNTVINNSKELISFSFYGGNVDCERKMVRFGAENDIDVILPFPIAILKITPVNAKFSDTLTHRDFLGALLNLGVDRGVIGDIIVRDNSAYVFVTNEISAYISENLVQVKHTRINVDLCESVPDGVLFSLDEKRLIISSMRLDCIVSGVYNLSRAKCDLLFKENKIFCNGKLIVSANFIPKSDDIISVRGNGRFRIGDVSGNTKKGKTVLTVMKYV